MGRIAKPDKIQFVSGLPKTRSGKIMRRILRKIAEGEMSNLGDTTTLLDPGVVEEIKGGGCEECACWLETDSLVFGRAPALCRRSMEERGRAFRCKSSLVPRCGLSAAIAHAGAVM